MNAGAWTFPDEPEAEPRPEPQPDPQPGDRFDPIDFPSLAGQEPPERRFVVKEWVPAGCVTGLWGEGGIGKSMLAQQIATLVAIGRSGFGFEVEAGAPVMGIFAEDDKDELWRRQTRINGALGIAMDRLAGMHLQGRFGLENTLAIYPPGRPPAAQPLVTQISEACEKYRAGLVIVDNIAKVFGGNENDRFQVSYFCNLIGGIVRDFGCAVLLLGRPSKGQGSEYSGSTAWSASVRARMFLGRDKKGGLRLTRSKANYAADDPNGGLELGWAGGVLRPVDDVRFGGELGELIRRGQEKPVEDAFLAALDRLTALGEVVSSSPRAGNYAPRIMRRMGFVGELGEPALRDAMLRLIERGALATDHPVRLKPDRKWAHGLARKPADGAASADGESAGESAGGGSDDSDAGCDPETSSRAACGPVPPSYRGNRTAPQTAPRQNRTAPQPDRGPRRKSRKRTGPRTAPQTAA